MATNETTTWESGRESSLLDDIIAGRKTIEGRLNKGKFAKYRVGDTVKLRRDIRGEDGVLRDGESDAASVAIVAVRNYPDFLTMVQAEGFEKVIPSATSAEEAAGEYNKYYSVADQAEYGVLAIEIEPLRGNEAFEALSPEDIAQLLKESMGAFLPSASNPTETTQDLFAMFQKDASFRIMGYRVDGVPVTYITFLDYKQPDVMAIGPMYVAKRHRGKGLGKRQVEAVVDIARKEGRTAIYTKTWGKNSGSRRIFDDFGFTVQKIKENDRMDGDSTVSYWLDLT